jgi:sec-independent protein translocase protein TatC
MPATTEALPSTKETATKLAEDLRDLKLSPETKEAMARYLPYLEEAQRKLLFTLVIFIATVVGSAIFYKPIMTFVMSRFNLTGISMVFTSPLQFFEVAVQIGIYAGLIIAIPLFLFNILSFLRPALKPEEYKSLTGMVPVAISLFILGFLLGAWVEQFVVAMFSGATAGTNIMNIWDVSRFFSEIMIMGLLMGLIFQFPIVLTLLLRFKVVQRAKLVKARPYVYAASVLFAILMPPQDLLSDLILSLPLFFLFEITLLLNRD